MATSSGFIGRLLEGIASIFGTSVQRLLVGSGFALVTGVAFYAAIENALNAVTGSIAGITGDLLSIILLAGTGDAISIIGAAVLTRASWDRGQPIIRRLTEQ